MLSSSDDVRAMLRNSNVLSNAFKNSGLELNVEKRKYI